MAPSRQADQRDASSSGVPTPAAKTVTDVPAPESTLAQDAPTDALDGLPAALDGDDPQLRYKCIRFLAEQLTDCCQTFDGDLEQVLVMAVLGQRALGAQHMARLDPENASDMAWLAALRLADVTGLPRETVRRKLKLLEARHWVRHDIHRGWALADEIVQAQRDDDLIRFEQRLRRRLIRLLLGLRPFLR